MKEGYGSGCEPVYYFHFQEVDLPNPPGLELYFDNRNIVRESHLGSHGAVEVVISLTVFQGRRRPWFGATEGVQVLCYPAVWKLYESRSGASLLPLR